MNRLFFFLVSILLDTIVAQAVYAENAFSSWAQSTKARLHQIFMEGKNEAYIPAYTWHNRYKYTSNKIERYNEQPWGGGFGKSFYDEKANWHALYAFTFLDSHKNIEPVAGYGYLKVSHLSEHFAMGGGYTILVTARPDILHNIPFPGVLPLLSFTYRRASIAATYVPGSQNVGNVLFVFARYMLQ